MKNIKIRSEVMPETIKVLKILAEIKEITMYQIISEILNEYANDVSLDDLKKYENR